MLMVLYMKSVITFRIKQIRISMMLLAPIIPSFMSVTSFLDVVCNYRPNYTPIKVLCLVVLLEKKFSNYLGDMYGKE